MNIKTFGSQRQYWFNSQELIESAEYIRILQRRPVPHEANPLVVADRPWEGTVLQLFAAVEHDPTAVSRQEADGPWRMWYEGHPGPVNLCLAVSDDGIRWRKPALGIEEFAGSTANNLVLQTGYWDAHQPAVVRSPAEADPARRYKLYYWAGPRWGRWATGIESAPAGLIARYPQNGVYLAFSADGVRWTPHGRAPVLPVLPSGDASGRAVELNIWDVNTVLWDEQRDCYRSFHVVARREPGAGLTRRSIATSESEDGIRFSVSRPVLWPTEEDDAWGERLGGKRVEYYGLHVWPLAGFYLGLLWVFLITQTSKVPQSRLWDDGMVAPYLVYSPDGLTWRHLPVREPFIPAGPAGSFQAGSIYSAGRPVAAGDDLRFYYHGVSYTHGADEPIDSPHRYSGIGLATLPRDRYVAWQDGTAEGVLRTVPLRLSGQELHLNLDAARGATRVALLGLDGSPLPGYSLEDCLPLTADGLDQVVQWRGSSDLSALNGEMVRLLFALRHSALYTWEYRIRNSANAQDRNY